jgi:hypothetical protein
MFRPVEGSEYHQVLVVDAEGEYCAGGGYTTEIPPCLGTAELRRKLLSLLPQGMGKCSEGCHEVLVRDERDQHIGISIYLTPIGWNTN